MKYSFLCVCILVFVGVAAHGQSTISNFWHPNTKILDIAASMHVPTEGAGEGTLAQDVKSFYIALRDKQWHKTYVGRAKVYRTYTRESEYMAIAIENGEKWTLSNYEVLSLEIENSTPTSGVDTAVLICKFDEYPGRAATYSTVYWHREDGGWKCLTAGPKKLSIFSAVVGPHMDWR